MSAARLTSAQSSTTLPESSPITETIDESTRSDAACIASPRALVTLTPSSKEIAPAKQRAEYSPSERPIAAVAESITASPFSIRSFSTAAIDATKIAGCDTAVESSTSFGPFTHLPASKLHD